MTQVQPSGQDILAAARRLQEEKLAAVETVAGTRARIGLIRAEYDAKLAEVEREDATAYQAALRAGWTEDELRKVGITAPARQAPGRPRRKARRIDVSDVERSGADALMVATLQREAEASVRLDGETHVVGEPVPA